MYKQEVYIEPDDLPDELYELEIPSDAIHIMTAVYNYGPMNERKDYFSISAREDEANWILWRLDEECDNAYRVCAILPMKDKDQTVAAAEMLESFWDTRSSNFEGEGPWDEAWGSACVSDEVAMEIYERIWGPLDDD